MYNANFYTGGSSLLHLDGCPRAFFQSESFTNNGDASRESIVKYSMNSIQPATAEMTIPSALRRPSSFVGSTLGKSLIYLRRSIQFSMTAMTFNNNWQIDTDYASRA